MVRWVDERVEVQFTDAHGAVWSLIGDIPAAGAPLTSVDEVGCEVVGIDGELLTISTSRPDGFATAEGRSEFQVMAYQLRDSPVVREAGFYNSAAEVRAAMAGGEQHWEQDALRYLEQGLCTVVCASYATDLLDPNGRGVAERGEHTDGVWFWDGTLVHYLRKYHVALPQEFLAHMAANEWTVPPLDDMDSILARRYPFRMDDVAAPVAEA